MSVQLIVYPQNYNGQFNAFASSSVEFLVNGLIFTGLNSTPIFSSASNNVPLAIMNSAPPTIPNTWYRFISTGFGTSPTPVVTSNDLVLESTAAVSLSFSGVYQRITNTNIGQTYNLIINLASIPSPVNGNLIIQIYDGTTQSAFTIISPNALQLTYNFQAPNTNFTVILGYYNTGFTNTVTIDNLSVKPMGTTPGFSDFELEDGQVICDLYEDEDIPLSLSVDNFKNVAEKVQSYSKAFKLPATKRNNLIFDNMFEVTRTDDGIIFNPYVKTECVLKQDGFILFKGYLKMLDINDKEGEISYNVNLYSEVVALADILKDRTFSDLNFTELEHEYNRTQITYSWSDSGTGITYTNPSTSGYRNANDTVKYPFVDWSHQFIVADSGGTPTAGNPQLPTLESAFRPFIQLKYLINRIFAASPFTWESSLFDSDDFEKLYMDFNWGADNAPALVADTSLDTLYLANTGTSPGFNYATTSFSVMELTINIPFIGGFVPPNYNTSTNVITSTVSGETYTIDYSYSIENTDTVARELECQWLYNSTPINFSGVQTISAGGTYNYQGIFTQLMAVGGDTLQVQFKTNAGTASKVRQSPGIFPTGAAGAYVTFNFGALNITSGILLQTLRGELGQWDFLKGLMTMFNLVSLPDEDNPNNIKFEPYGDIFIQNTVDPPLLTLAARSIQHDWTDRIDVAEMKLTPLTDLNKNTIFKFAEDDDDFCFMEYKRQAGGHLYGSKKYDASIASNGLATVLQGTKEIVAEPFAATISDTLMPQYPGIVIPKIYASSDDETEGFDNAPRILYNNGIKDSGITYYIPEQSGVTSTNITTFLQFSHLTDIPTIISSPPAITDTSDFHFGECQLPNGLGASTPRNLFNLYWLPYYNELYNPDTRAMTIKVNLSPSIINTFKFNDTVMLKNREFRVNKIDYKPNDLATVEFILIP